VTVQPLRQGILAAAKSERLRRTIERFGPTRAVVHRFVGGTTVADVVATAPALGASGRLVTVDHLGEDVFDDAGAEATVAAYEELIPLLGALGRADVSVKLSALGLAHDPTGAIERAGRIVAAANAHGVTVTVDMEASAQTDPTLDAVRVLRKETPSVACVLQAMLRRTETDAREMGSLGARVRLCKGAYVEANDVAYRRRDQVNASYVRALTILWDSPGTPLVATHDPLLLHAASELARRRPRPFEFQMLYGVRPDEQVRLAAANETVRIYLPFGAEWYGYLMRRLAERPANVAFFLRALRSSR
jgi:proline dehydrogenase